LLDAGLAWWELLDPIAIGAQYATTHSGAASEIGNRNAAEPQGPGGQQVEGTVPGKVIQPGRGFEECNWPARRRRGNPIHGPGEVPDADIIQPPDGAAEQALGK
jgi:hypothetical protein